MKRPDRKLNGVVEYCFSGMRFKVRVDNENSSIAFNLHGVKTLPNDKNMPQLLELSNMAQKFAKDNLFQKDVILDVDFADKRGTFFGSLTYKNKQDFALDLIAEGLAQVSVFGNRAFANRMELEREEEKAKEHGVGMWNKSLKSLFGSSPKKVR